MIVAHNSEMADYLSKRYESKIVVLGLFDYLLPSDVEPPTSKSGIDIAGNLSPEKAGYVYQLSKKFPGFDFNLYGPGFDERAVENEMYKGSFLPNDLISHLNGQFGLVWDGDSTSTCSGKYGTYIRFNNPYKLSLYLALGKPVIIWDKAAASKIVRENNCGLTADSIDSAIEMISEMSDTKYKEMCSSAIRVGKQLRTGFYTKRAIQTVVELLED